MWISSLLFQICMYILIITYLSFLLCGYQFIISALCIRNFSAFKQYIFKDSFFKWDVPFHNAIQRYTNDRRDIRIRCTNLVKYYRIYIKARVKGAALKLKVERRRSLAEGETTQQVLLESTEESLFRYGEHVSLSRLSLFNLSGFQVKLREQTITLP